MKKGTPTEFSSIERPPVIVIMGHIDHGKSTLLDYIRKENVVDTEAGGITQHLSAYEVVWKGKEGNKKRITFLDTPGHEAFQKMRLRGADVADIAILIVSAEDGVKAQTLEALDSIKKADIPYVVAINKIDKPGADIEKTKQSLLEKEIYLEGLGGDVPWVPISAKSGEGIPELLDIVLLVAELEELKGSPEKNAEGIVTEAHLDTKKGISAALVIKDGTLKSGQYVASGDSLAPVRILEDFVGNSLKEATFSSPVRVVGFNKTPEVGAFFYTFSSKKEAEKYVEEAKERNRTTAAPLPKKEESEDRLVIPIILKADASGSIDAIEHELEKLPQERVCIKVIQKGVGTISESDVKVAMGAVGTLVIGFNTKADTAAQDLADRSEITLKQFDIIYKLSEWLEETVKERTPKVETETVLGKIKILKVFSKTKNKYVVGGRIEDGVIEVGQSVRIMRKETNVGKGKITNLQQNKADVKKIEEGEFGAQVESALELLPGDHLEAIKITMQ